VATAQGGGEPGTPAEAEPARRTLLERLDDVSGWVKFFGGLLGLATAVLTTVFLLWPNLKPEPTPSEGSATFATKPTVSAPMTFGQYLDRIDLSREGHSAEQLAKVGAFAAFKVTIKGFEGERLPLRWLLVNAGTNDVVGEDSKRTAITPDRQTTPVAWHVWAELPRDRRQRFKLVIEIYPPGAKVDTPSIAALDSTETDPFQA
jgi:hypothetical protein